MIPQDTGQVIHESYFLLLLRNPKKILNPSNRNQTGLSSVYMFRCWIWNEHSVENKVKTTP